MTHICNIFLKGFFWLFLDPPKVVSHIVSHRQTMIQANFMDFYGSRVYVVCFISCPLNCVRKLLCNLWTLKACCVNISLVPSLSTWHSMTFKYYSSWSWIGFTSWMGLTYKYGHRSPWQNPISLETIQTMIIPTWMVSLHLVQLELVSAIFEGQDIPCRTTIGNGKSVAFTVPGVVLLKYNAHLDTYPARLPTWKRPIGVIITPTKGLANNIICFIPFSHVMRSPLSRVLNCQMRLAQWCIHYDIEGRAQKWQQRGRQWFLKVGWRWKQGGSSMWKGGEAWGTEGFLAPQ